MFNLLLRSDRMNKIDNTLLALIAGVTFEELVNALAITSKMFDHNYYRHKDGLYI